MAFQPMPQDFGANYMEQFAKTRASDFGKNERVYPQFPWRDGRNVIRIFPFNHVVTQYDLEVEKLGKPLAMGFKPEDLGKTVQLLFRPVIRYSPRVPKGEKTVITNGLGFNNNCPMFVKAKETKNNGRLCVAVNAMSMDPQDIGLGIMPVILATEWFGRKDKSGNLVSYGLSHVIYGLKHPPVEDKSKPGDNKFGSSTKPILGEVDGLGYTVVGQEGQDIVILKHKELMFGDMKLALDITQPGGPIMIADKSKSLRVPDELMGKVQDLFGNPFYFPGYSSSRNHLWPVATQFADEFYTLRKAKGTPTAAPVAASPFGFKGPQEPVGGAIPASPPVASPTPPIAAPSAPQGPLTPSPTVTFTPGQRVSWSDDGQSYLGTVGKVKDDNQIFVILKVEEQTTPQAAADVAALALSSPGEVENSCIACVRKEKLSFV